MENTEDDTDAYHGNSVMRYEDDYEENDRSLGRSP